MKRLEKEELPCVRMLAALLMNTLSVQTTKRSTALRAVTCKP